VTDEREDIERVLRWAVIERGTATLSDELGPDVIVPGGPRRFTPAVAAIAGPVVLLRRALSSAPAAPFPSFRLMRETVHPGDVVLVGCDRSIGAAFGSNLVLMAAAMRAQAMVTDGAWRDGGRLEMVGIPVGADSTCPKRPAGHPYEVTGHLDMFGVRWRPGDWFLRDADGVLRLPAALAARAASQLMAEPGGELSGLLGGR
jgi:regulator of RNase E activity RraA